MTIAAVKATVTTLITMIVLYCVTWLLSAGTTGLVRFGWDFGWGMFAGLLVAGTANKD